MDDSSTAPKPGRAFNRLWAAFAVSALGTWLAFDAFPMIAVLALHTGPGRVSLLAAAGPAVGAAAAVPLGPWVERRRKRPVLVAGDLARCAALLTVPVALALGGLGFTQLLLVSTAVGTCDIAFRAASGAHLKTLVAPDALLTANSRLESTTWTASVLGPSLGGAAIGALGSVATVALDAVSHLLSALGIRAIKAPEPQPAPDPGRLRLADLTAGWRHLLTHPGLRPLYLNTVLVNALIMATTPVLAVLMLGPLGFARGSTGSPSPHPASAGSSAPGSPAPSPPATGDAGYCSPPERRAPAGRSGSPSSWPSNSG